MPLTSLGFETKSWKSFHSPCPVVEPNDAGCRSDMSKRKTFAVARATAVLRLSGSLYADAFTFLLGDEKPPRFAQMVDACGVARKETSARAAALSLSMMTVSPPPMIAERVDALSEGNGNTL